MTVCEFHDQIMKENAIALEGKVTKSTIKWIAGIFALPMVLAILATYAFVTSADYKYADREKVREVASDVRLLEERTATIKTEVQKLNLNMVDGFKAVQETLADVNKELRRTVVRSSGGSTRREHE